MTPIPDGWGHIVASVSSAPSDTMGNMPFTVTPSMVCDAILAADALGRYYHLDIE